MRADEAEGRWGGLGPGLGGWVESYVVSRSSIVVRHYVVRHTYDNDYEY